MDDKLVRLSDVKALFHRGDERTFPFSFPGLVTERDVDSIPAVDAVEVRHVTWKRDANGNALFYCSECHEGVTIHPPTQLFCYHCGARMDGRREDGDE